MSLKEETFRRVLAIVDLFNLELVEARSSVVDLFRQIVDVRSRMFHFCPPAVSQGKNYMLRVF